MNKIKKKKNLADLALSVRPVKTHVMYDNSQHVDCSDCTIRRNNPLGPTGVPVTGARRSDVLLRLHDPS